MQKIKAELGQGLVEYALILALVGIVVIIVLSILGSSLYATYVCILMSTGSQGNGSIPAVQDFVLIDASTSNPIQRLTCGGTFEKVDIGTNVTIAATVSNSNTFGSIKFELTGPINHNQQENSYPFVAFGDSGANNMTGRNLPIGRYELRAIPYSQNNYQGQVGLTYVIIFTVE